MKTLILAAGRGERMKPLTDNTPKALLLVNNKPLITYHIERLASAGMTDIVINLAHLGDQIQQQIGNGQQFGVNIQYSPEPKNGYETGGGILHAMPLLGTEPFFVINADIWTDFPFQKLPKHISGHAHLILADNPEHNPEGDFCFENGALCESGKHKLTFTGMGIYHPHLFANSEPGFFPLKTLIGESHSRRPRQCRALSRHLARHWHPRTPGGIESSGRNKHLRGDRTQ